MTDTLPLKRERKSHVWARSDDDWYVEPHWVSRRLFEEEKFDGAVWDPACGSGRICESARASGHTIVYSDICDRGYDPLGMKVIRDFLDLGGKQVENIVTNPPFDIARQFTEHALELAKFKIAIVFPTARLNAAHWVRAAPLRRVWLLTPRPSMPPGRVVMSGEKAAGGKMDFCWLVFDRSFRGDRAEICWLQRDPPYCPKDDFGKSIDAAYAEVRARKAAGGEGWEPKP